MNKYIVLILLLVLAPNVYSDFNEIDNILNPTNYMTMRYNLDYEGQGIYDIKEKICYGQLMLSGGSWQVDNSYISTINIGKVILNFGSCFYEIKSGFFPYGVLI